ncbi:hypothetical protein [Ramlibacter sp. 2FC]|uniref:hypothetical protein n=1 Tax=Ramlibacter sp. 2FC TaxID=2502188 RepID=UPI0010F75A3F|nr:hypothetical protein [Ramlibacter sp. 2FC]
MNTMVEAWHYASTVPVQRVQALLAWSSFSEIACQIAESSVVVSAEWEPFQTATLAGCNRASVLLSVPKPIYDAFYNAPVGIRGQYARSETAGEQADRFLIDQHESELMCALARCTKAPRDLLQRSLRAKQAKTWIKETESDTDEGDEGIVYEPWEREAISRDGLRTPVGTLLEVKGGWIDAQGMERLNPTKTHRSYTLHRTGYV